MVSRESNEYYSDSFFALFLMEEVRSVGEAFWGWEEGRELFKWAFEVFNGLVGLLLYQKAQHQTRYSEQVDRHHQNPNRDRVALVIAHPDDEAMFFAPTIKELVSEGKELTVICFSNGGFDGLGQIRAEELQASCQGLGVSHVHLIDHPELQDGPKESWSHSLIAQLLQEHQKEGRYGTFITFDDRGVSGHPNHISVHYGVR